MSIPAIPLNPLERIQVLAELESLRFLEPLDLRGFLGESEKLTFPLNAPLLEKFEQLDLFRPLFHVTYPTLRSKAEYVDGSQRSLRMIEPLKPGERWTGPVYSQIVYPHFHYQPLADWLAAGRVRPSVTNFSKSWRRYRRKGEEIGSPFFSIFQLLPLHYQLLTSTLRENLAWYLELEESDPRRSRRLLKQRVQAARHFLGGSSTATNPRFDTAFICQAIASRYFFETQGDVRTISIREVHQPERSWETYRSRWKPTEVASRLGVSAETIKRHHEIALHAAEQHDPLIEWHDLIRFVSLEKKRGLLREAKFGQLLHCMEEMLRRFHAELTGSRLTSPLSRFQVRSAEGEVENPSETSDALRLISNSYHVNPQPKLYIFVEGAGELEVLPGLIEAIWGTKAHNLGIELRSLGGVQGLEGQGRHLDGTLPRLIEELHHLQTLTFILVDNEGKSSSSLLRLRRRLSETASTLHPNRSITRHELFFVWRTCFELENFSNEELAVALQSLAKGGCQFAPSDVAGLRTSFGKQGATFHRLFESRSGTALSKRKLLRHLTEAAAADRSSLLKRPISRLLKELVHMAALNHQPTLSRTSARNQASGFLGNPCGRSGDANVERLMMGLTSLSKEFGLPQVTQEASV